MEWTTSDTVWVERTMSHQNIARKLLLAPSPPPSPANDMQQTLITGLNPFVTIAAFIACSIFIVCLCFRVVIGQVILSRQAARDGRQRNDPFPMVRSIRFYVSYVKPNFVRQLPTGHNFCSRNCATKLDI